MRIADLLQPHQSQITRVIDSSNGALLLDRYLRAAELPPVEKADAAEIVLERGNLLVAVVGDDAELHGTNLGLVGALERARPGALVVILFGHPLAELPYHQVLDLLASNGFLVQYVQGLDYQHLFAGALASRVETGPAEVPELLGPPLTTDQIDAVWATGDLPGPNSAGWLRAAGAYRFLDAVSRAERLRTRKVLGRSADDLPGLLSRLAQAERERGVLTRQVAEGRSELDRLRRRTTDLERSTTMKVGKVLVSAAKRPARAPVRLPRELYRLWQSRGVGAVSSAPSQEPAATADVGVGDRWLSHTSIQVGPRLLPSVAGVVSDATAAALSGCTALTRLQPESAITLLERVRPDLLLIDTAAGGEGAWAGLGELAVPERDGQLARLAEAAGAAGVPVVLWWNDPVSRRPGLSSLERRCDLVLGGPNGLPWTLGVPLQLFNPFGATNSGGPVTVLADPARAGATRGLLGRRLGEAAPAGLRALAPGEDLATAFRTTRVAVLLDGRAGAGVPPRAALQALACGSSVVLPGVPTSWAEGLTGVVAAEPDVDSIAKAVTALLEEAAADPVARIRVLAELARRWATPVQVAALTGRLGIEPDPLLARTVSVVASPRSTAELDTLVAEVSQQRHSAAEIVLELPADGSVPLTDRARSTLTSAGARTVLVPAVQPGTGQDPAAAARRATCEWAAVWKPEGHGPDWLLRLVAAGEAAGADVVAVDGARLVRTDHLGGTGSLLLRRSAAAAAGPEPEHWHAQGLRLVALPEGATL